MKEDQKKVYIVTCGCYSAYSISRVFSTKEKAKEYLDTVDDDYNIEEYALDEPIERNEKVFCVKFGLDNKGEGEVTEAGDCMENLIHVDDFDDDPDNLEIFVQSDSRERAVKIASERYGDIIANERIKFPYLRFGILRYTTHRNKTAYFDFFTGEVVLQKDDRLISCLPDFIKFADRMI